MKKIILICIVLLFGVANNSFSIPVHDYGTDTDGMLNLNNSIQSPQFTLNEYASVSFEGISSNSQINIDSNNTRVFSNTWIPAWGNHNFKWNNFNKLFGSFFSCPRPNPKPGDNPSPVPEPATILLFGSGMIGLAYIRRKNKNKSA